MGQQQQPVFPVMYMQPSQAGGNMNAYGTPIMIQSNPQQLTQMMVRCSIDMEITPFLILWLHLDFVVRGRRHFIGDLNSWFGSNVNKSSFRSHLPLPGQIPLLYTCSTNYTLNLDPCIVRA